MPRKPRFNPEMTTGERQLITKRDYARRRKHGPQPEPCFVCGSEPAECHHIDYSDPERRMWLCSKCHSAYHSQFGKPAPTDWEADIRAAMKRIDAKRLALRQGRARSIKPPG